MGDRGFLTIKGKSDSGGLSRYEWEREIPEAEALDLLQLCLPGMIEKTRHYIACGKHTVEVDVFHGENEGLTLAEVELSTVDEPFEPPCWLGEEVTGDPRYYNAALMKCPFLYWK